MAMKPKIEVIYKDKNLLAINKPAGLLVHPIEGKKSEATLTDWLLEKYPEVKTVGDDPEHRPGIVHRLDKDTSGIILVPRNQKTFEYLKNLFQTHQIQKTYTAIVWGKMQPASGVIKKPIGIKTGTLKRTSDVRHAKMVKDATTVYRTVRRLKWENHDLTLLEVAPKTGRTHQIRIHLASTNHPIVGDRLYGGRRPTPSWVNRQFLHAGSVEFTLPDGKLLKLTAKLPKDLNLEKFETADPDSSL
ncbi:MAG: 23S rRNA pseudouridine synthase [Parcubacteria group bacterium Gr01-1014_3]|nr:MAG: 23S rRNA pseudouridine synthase [Parcubacteria group bacterium Gr01-1014_3]